MHTFVEWGNTGQYMAESLANTTFLTTNGKEDIHIKSNTQPIFVSSNGLLKLKCVWFENTCGGSCVAQLDKITSWRNETERLCGNRLE